MSSYRTHALIGAVGGLGLARLLDMVPHATAISQNPFAQLGPASIVPPGVTAVAESGIKTAEDVKKVRALGARAVLVGESLLRQNDLESAARILVEAGQ